MTLDEFDGAGLAPVNLHDVFDLFAPVGRARFLAEYWERRPLLIRGRAGAMKDVAGIEAIDSVVGSRAIRRCDLRAARDHHQIPADELFVDGVADKQMILDAFEAGYTMVFDQVDRHVPALAQLLYSWESSLRLPVRANAYLTPRSSSGFHRHFDTHDVIVVQLHGIKTWEVCDAPLPLPHEEQQGDSSRCGGLASPMARVELAPGDVLYLPRGHVHAAAAERTDALHLSVSIRNRALREVALDALRTQLLASPTFRRSHVFGRDEVGHIRHALSELVERADLRTALEQAADVFHQRRQQPHRRLERIEAAQTITMDTPLACRRGWRGGDGAFAGDHPRQVLEFARSRPAFSAAEIPGLPAPDCLRVARDLFATGAIDILAH